MSTALSSTDPVVVRRTRLAEARRAVADAGALFAFRAGALRGRARRYASYGVVGIAVVTLLASWLPTHAPEGGVTKQDVLVLLPSMSFGILVIAVVSATASGGGRELMPREQGVAFPVSATTDHLGALMMAPLNIAWLLQAWTLLGAVAFAFPPSWRLVAIQLVMLLWLLAATALAQLIAWTVEWVRRGPHGVWAVRGIGASVALLTAFLVATDRLVPLLDRSRVTFWLVEAMGHARADRWWSWSWRIAVLAALLMAAVVLGAWVAGAVARRHPRDELRLESAPYRPRPHPTSELLAIMRTDRVGIWRSVPLRRGLFVLGLMPGAVAMAGGLDWEMLTILPGLVASGGALLFGVNSWCLDGRGALWRDSLPVSPKVAFGSRVVVLVEVLVFTTLLTLALASLRAGRPTVSELVAVLCAALVVILQVVARSLRWSVSRPYAVDMRSSRATPAPPLVMVGYSARLALSTTMTGLLFALTSQIGADWSLVLATPFLLFSTYRLVQASEAWADPEVRCRVVSTVAS